MRPQLAWPGCESVTPPKIRNTNRSELGTAALPAPGVVSPRLDGLDVEGKAPQAFGGPRNATLRRVVMNSNPKIIMLIIPAILITLPILRNNTNRTNYNSKALPAPPTPVQMVITKSAFDLLEMLDAWLSESSTYKG